MISTPAITSRTRPASPSASPGLQLVAGVHRRGAGGAPAFDREIDGGVGHGLVDPGDVALTRGDAAAGAVEQGAQPRALLVRRGLRQARAQAVAVGAGVAHRGLQRLALVGDVLGLLGARGDVAELGELRDAGVQLVGRELERDLRAGGRAAQARARGLDVAAERVGDADRAVGGPLDVARAGGERERGVAQDRAAAAARRRTWRSPGARPVEPSRPPSRPRTCSSRRASTGSRPSDAAALRDGRRCRRRGPGRRLRRRRRSCRSRSRRGTGPRRSPWPARARRSARAASAASSSSPERGGESGRRPACPGARPSRGSGAGRTSRRSISRSGIDGLPELGHGAVQERADVVRVDAQHLGDVAVGEVGVVLERDQLAVLGGERAQRAPDGVALGGQLGRLVGAGLVRGGREALRCRRACGAAARRAPRCGRCRTATRAGTRGGRRSGSGAGTRARTLGR